ncbi:malic enzyme, NAD binding domain-containing protein [Baffinella frigidus]|nr:malic enzyme, NAD binding domain-containing protein [Cryptophyta sp. CCMP2293]
MSRAGEAGTGIADLIAEAVAAEDVSVTVAQARRRIFMMDSKGLITSSRTGLVEHKRPYAHDTPGLSLRDGSRSMGSDKCATLMDCIQTLRPSALIGVAARSGAFTKETLRPSALLGVAARSGAFTKEVLGGSAKEVVPRWAHHSKHSGKAPFVENISACLMQMPRGVCR